MPGRRRYLAGTAALVVIVAAGCQTVPVVRGAAAGGTQSVASPTPAPSRPPSPSATPRPDQPTGWGPTVREWRAARRAVARLSDAELAGQVIVAGYGGTAAPTGLVSTYHLGGVIMLEGNIASTQRAEAVTRRLQRSSHRGWPLVITTDQEGGIVQRVGPPLTQFPTFMSYGAAADPGLTEAAARASGQELRAAGFTMVLAPDADVTIGPADPTIGSRSAGDQPAAVAAQVVAAERGYQESGIVSVVKHFPGHGSLRTDSHVALPVQHRSLAQLRRRDFVPFAAAVDAGANGVMVGHIALAAVDPAVPADLSEPDVALLSSSLHFHGLITTDALNMAAVSDGWSSAQAAVDALKAGIDLLLMPADVDAAYHGILDALHDRTLRRGRLEQAAAKIVALMLHEEHAPPVRPATIGSHHALSERVSAEALTLVSGRCDGPYVGRTVTPSGESSAVAAFSRAARAGGLTVGPGGTTVALVGYGYPGADADVVVSLDTPYALATSRARTASFALFGADVDAMRALVAALTGRATVTGRLPVSFPGLDQQRRC